MTNSLSEINLPRTTEELIKTVPISRRHPGLQLDKLSFAPDQKGQKRALDKVVGCGGDQKALEELSAKRAALLRSIGALEWSGVTSGPLTLHLARASALENAGICLHPVYGFPYLPGSGLKGVARAYAEAVWLKEQPDKQAAWQQLEDIFGWALNPVRSAQPEDSDHPARERTESAEDGGSRTIEAACGSVVFHDAWPVTWPELGVDIVNNHHPLYYGAAWNDSDTIPGDWESPQPVYFLCLARGTTFSFAVSSRRGDPREARLAMAREWLSSALAWLGAGAKTAAGYGRFIFPDVSAIAAPMTLKTYETVVELVTPAFLAGARQDATDCDLRSAALRGLLRWWWRTLHADVIGPRELRELEKAVWGSTESGGPVQLWIETEKRREPELYAFKEKYALKQRFADAHRLVSRGRGTPGLLYLSYGMDDGETHRHYLPPGASWRVRLLARDSRFVRERDQRDGTARDTVTLPADLVLDQARAALWLLRHFGGVGAKGRKGFGSLDEDDTVDLDWCIGKGAELRAHCQLDASPARAYSTSQIAEIGTSSADWWWVLRELGHAVRDFANDLKHDPRKEALGLPRRIHGPKDRPLRHQNAATHKPPMSLGEGHPMREKGTSASKMRHAAPIHYHVGRGPDGNLMVRVVAFPSEYLPDLATSESVLHEAIASVSRRLSEVTTQAPMAAPNYRKAHRKASEPATTAMRPTQVPQTRSPQQPEPKRERPEPIVKPKGELEEFREWFEAQGFSGGNKGKHHQIRQKIEGLPEDIRPPAKEFVREKLGKKATTDGLWDYLNS